MEMPNWCKFQILHEGTEEMLVLPSRSVIAVCFYHAVITILDLLLSIPDSKTMLGLTQIKEDGDPEMKMGAVETTLNDMK